MYGSIFLELLATSLHKSKLIKCAGSEAENVVGMRCQAEESGEAPAGVNAANCKTAGANRRANPKDRPFREY
jgi:hypothetical protein